MSPVLVHQLLHGYQKGHQLLAGSVRLSGDAADLVARLSDLSGALPPRTPLPPYLTTYPVAGSGYYAVARTCLDQDAPRSGCVLTHTILVPLESWKGCGNPAGFIARLAPVAPKKGLGQFESPLEVDAKSVEGHFMHRAVAAPGSVEFVAKYFGEGIRPLVWFDCESPEEALSAILSSLWPSLRQRFTACTFCLQPRSTGDGPFDLMFAPGSAYPRFHGIPREGVVRPSQPLTQAVAGPAESWVEELWRSMFGGAASPIIGRESAVFGTLLKEDPSSIRTLFLVSELRSRLSKSPTAGIGLMDVLETVAPGEKEAVSYKKEILSETLDALESVPSQAALKSLFLVSERLSHLAYGSVASVAAPRVAVAVSARTPNHLRYALSAPCRTLPAPSGMAVPPYVEGLLRGLERQAESSPSELLTLRDFPDTAGLVVCLSPKIARGYLRGAREAGLDAIMPLVRWIEQSTAAGERERLRELLLPEVERDEEASLAEELLRDVPGNRAAWAIDVLFDSTDGFRPERVREVACEMLAGNHRATMREWGSCSPRWSQQAAEVVAASFDAGPDGLREFLDSFAADEVRRSEILAAFLDRSGPGRHPSWLKEYARQHGDFLLPLLAAGRRTPPHVARCVARLLGEGLEISIAKTLQIVPLVGEFADFPFYHDLVERALRSALKEYLEGDLDLPGCNEWLSASWGLTWLGNVPPDELLRLLRTGPRDGPARERAWGWVAGAPQVLYRRDPAVLPGVVEGLIPGPMDWLSPASCDHWVTVLRRGKQETSEAAHLKLCDDAVAFSLNHIHMPIGGLVAEAFPEVYSAVSSSSDAPEYGGFLRFFHWDRAKELRMSLIEAFLNSNWRPSDLAIAAGGEILLRKLFKRIRRRWKGEQYIAAMIEDLWSRTDPPAVEARAILLRLSSDPDFYEPWD